MTTIRQLADQLRQLEAAIKEQVHDDEGCCIECGKYWAIDDGHYTTCALNNALSLPAPSAADLETLARQQEIGRLVEAMPEGWAFERDWYIDEDRKRQTRWAVCDETESVDDRREVSYAATPLAALRAALEPKEPPR